MLSLSQRFQRMIKTLGITEQERKVMSLARFGRVQELSVQQFTSWVLDLEYLAENSKKAA